MSTNTATYLEVEGLIVDRLSKMVSAVPPSNILTYVDFAALQESQRPTPGIDVLFGGQQPRRAPNGSLTQVIDQTWILIPVIRHVGSMLSGREARAIISPIISAIDSALLGWEPTSEHDAMQSVGSPPIEYSNGFLNYPLAYQTSYTARGLRI